MKKSLINRLLVPAAMVVLMASCTGKLSEYTNVIPADALLVVGFRTQSLIDKSGVSDNDKQKLMDAIKSGLNASTAQQIEKFMRDGSTFGLSMKDPVYLFVDGQLSSAAFVVKMDDVERFSKALEVMLPEMSIGPVVEADGYRRFTFKGGICAFNESVLLITAIHGDDDKILSALMKQVKGESIAVNAYFKNVSGKKGDIIFVGQPDALLNQIRRENPQLEGMGLAGPRNSAIIGSLSFEKGRIALQIETASEDKEVRAQLKRQSETFGELNETFVSRYPASAPAYSSFNVNGEKLYDLLMEGKDFRESIPADKAEEIGDLFGTIKGDVSIGITRVTSMGMPMFAAYAEATSGAALDAICTSEVLTGPKRTLVKLGENRYKYNTREMSIFLGYKDNYIYVTNDEAVFKNLDRREEDGENEGLSLKDAAYAPNMKDKHQYAVINVKAILDLPVVKLLITLGGREAAAYAKAASKISRIEASSEGNNRIDINIQLVDEDTGSIEQLLDLIRQYAGI